MGRTAPRAGPGETFSGQRRPRPPRHGRRVRCARDATAVRASCASTAPPSASTGRLLVFAAAIARPAIRTAAVWRSTPNTACESPAARSSGFVVPASSSKRASVTGLGVQLPERRRVDDGRRRGSSSRSARCSPKIVARREAGRANTKSFVPPRDAGDEHVERLGVRRRQDQRVGVVAGAHDRRHRLADRDEQRVGARRLEPGRRRSCRGSSLSRPSLIASRRSFSIAVLNACCSR